MAVPLETIKAALDRLSGCDLRHLSMVEAGIVQALRTRAFTDQELQAFLVVLLLDDDSCLQFKELLKSHLP